MWTDEIVEEVRAIREAHAARLGYDLDAIYQDLKEQEQHSQRPIVTLSSSASGRLRLRRVLAQDTQSLSKFIPGGGEG